MLTNISQVFVILNKKKLKRELTEYQQRHAKVFSNNTRTCMWIS